MVADSKKKKERLIFDLVYADRSFDEIKDFENPDFLLRYFPKDPYFGVEVTEQYLSETNARIDNISGYSGQLLNGGVFKHKDDRKVINITEIDIIDRNGCVHAKNISSIMQELPPPAKCASDLANRIISKSNLLQSFPTKLSHTNLIVKDNTGLLRIINKKNFYKTYFIPEVIKAISSAPFREIFLVTVLQDEHVYVPLKMLHLLAEVFLFNGALIQNGYEKKLSIDIDFAELFAAYLNSNCEYGVLIHKGIKDTEVIFGDSGIVINPDKSVAVRLHMDYPIDSNASPPSLEWRAILGERFIDSMNEYRKSNIFSTEACFPVKQSSTQQQL